MTPHLISPVTPARREISTLNRKRHSAARRAARIAGLVLAILAILAAVLVA